MADERVLQAILRFGLDRNSLEQVKQGALSVEQGLDRMKRRAQEAKEAAERLGQVGMRLTVLGGSISGAFLYPAQAFAQKMGAADAASRRWLAAQEELEKSQLRVGRIVAQQVAPAMETVARLANGIADVIDRYPWIAQAALYGGGLLTGLGTMTMVVSQVKGTVASMQWLAASMGVGRAVTGAAGGLGAAGGVGGAAAGAGGLALGGVGLAVLGGLGAGYAGATALGYHGGPGDAAKDVAQFVSRTAMLPFAGIAAGLKELGVISGQTANDVGRVIASIGNLGETAAASANQTFQLSADLVRLFGGNAGQALSAFQDYGRDMKTAAEAYLAEDRDRRRKYERENAAWDAAYYKQREELIKDFNQRALDEQADFGRRAANARRDREREEARAAREMYGTGAAGAYLGLSAARVRELARSGQLHGEKQGGRWQFTASDLQGYIGGQMADVIHQFVAQETKAEQAYYAARADRARAHSVEMSRIEEDYQRNVRRMAEDHQVRLADAIRARDARAILNETRSYERERRRAEEEHGVEERRRGEDYDRAMGDLERSFREQREARQADFEERLDEMRQQFAAQQAERQAEFEQTQAAAAAEFEQQQQTARERFEQKMADADAEHTQEKMKREEAQKAELDDLAQDYQDENKKRTDAFQAYLDTLTGMTNTANLKYAEIEDDFKTWLDRMKLLVQGQEPGERRQRQPQNAGAGFNYSYIGYSPGAGADQGRGGGGGTAGFYQAGGYAERGLAMLGENGREFVLNADTTRQLERSLGPLSQDRLLEAIQFGGVGRLEVDVSVRGDGGRVDTQALNRIAQEAIREAFRRVAGRQVR